MKNTLCIVVSLLIMACSGGGDAGSASNDSGEPEVDDMKGIGEITNVELTTPLDESMINSGKAIYQMKCAACHKLNDQRVVGPGWQGVTSRRTPEWIMNMVTNVDIMLDEDPAARALLEECLVRMPNQNVSIGDARDILEFMRHNDGVE
jgi:cytochrome c